MTDNSSVITSIISSLQVLGKKTTKQNFSQRANIIIPLFFLMSFYLVSNKQII